MTIEIATLGGGCFWCLEAVYQRVRGVKHVESGYAGGHKPNPSYEEVCSETTGHVEVVRVEFDSSEISYREILEIFYGIHDPTTLNRQGNDIGESYRSAIFTHSDAQMATAKGYWRSAQLLQSGGVSPGLLQPASQSGVLHVCGGA
jgi:peptide-methionine (S)-S-oxide reductase